MGTDPTLLAMRNKLYSLLPLLALLCGCDAVDLSAEQAPAFADDGLPDDLERPPAPTYRPGSTWGPCNPDDAWGCAGSLGEGDACLRPVSDDNLSLCAPQTWDPLIDDACNPDGVHLTDPGFGLGLRLASGAYCVPDCVDDADCGPGRKCSPASSICAWVG